MKCFFEKFAYATVAASVLCLTSCFLGDSESSDPAPEGFSGFPTLYSYLNRTQMTGDYDRSCEPGRFDIDTTLEMNLPGERYSFAISFGCFDDYFPECGYDDVSVKVDGKPIEIAYSYFYDKDTTIQIMLPDYTGEHLIEWSLDSAKCGHSRGSYRMVPSDEPGDYVIPEGDGFANNTAVISSYSIFKKGSLFFDVISEIQWRDRDWLYEYAYGDSAQSDCIAVSDGDTLHLPIVFVPNENKMRRPTARIDPDEEKVEKFLGDDTVATIACGMVYQSWIVPKKVKDFEYKTHKNVHFEQEYGDRLEEISCEDDLPCYTGEVARIAIVLDDDKWAYNQTSFVIAKTSKGDLIYKKIYVTWNQDGRYIFSDKDLVDESGDTLGFDYVQVVAFPTNGSGVPLVSSRESAEALFEIDKLCEHAAGCEVSKWVNDKESAQKMDSLFNLVVNEKGDPKDGVWIMAKRIGPLSKKE